MSKSVIDYPEITTPLDAMIMYIINGTGTDRDKKIAVSNLLAAERARLTDLETIQGNIVNGTQVLDGVSLSTGIKAFDKRATTFASSTTGWVTVAETPAEAIGIAGNIQVIDNANGNMLGVEFAVRSRSSGSRTFSNTTFKIKKPANPTGTQSDILRFRLLHKIGAAPGCKIEAYLDGVESITTLLSNHTAIDGTSGISLITAEATNGKTPDGQTADELVAGDTLNLDNPASFFGPFMGIAQTTNQIRLTIPWGQIPMPSATSLTLNLEGSSIVFKDATGSSASVAVSSPVVTSFNVVGNIVYCIFTETDIADGLASLGPCWPYISGGTPYLKLS